MKKLVLIDGNSMLFKTYYATAYQGGNIMRNHEGVPTNAVYGFINVIKKLMETSKPDYIMVAFDTDKKTFRHQEFNVYKAGRKDVPEELIVQFPLVREYLDLANIKRYEIAGYEADDIIATMAKIGSENNLKVEVYSSDKDLLQVIDDNVTVCMTRKGVTDLEMMTPITLKEKYSITPSQIPDLKGLMGDPSDNIPGVNGVGEKTAIKLLVEYGTIENIYENIDLIKGSLHDKLVKDKEMAFLSKKIATIYKDVSLPFSIYDLENKYSINDKLNDFFQKYDMKSFIKKVENKISEEFIDINGNIPEDFFDKSISIVVNLDNPNYHFANVLGFALSNGEKSYYVNSSILDNPNFVSFLTNKQKEKYGYDAKEFINSLVKYGIRVDGFTYDCSVASYLIDPSLNKEKGRVFEKYGYYLPSIDKKSTPEEVKKYYCLLALYVYKTKEKLLEVLKENEQLELFYQIEMPLVFVLAKMEKQGVKVDKNILINLGNQYKETINDIENRIYELIGRKINISSPKQVGEILFDDLNLPHNKKRSTSSEELKKIEKFHPIIPLILEHRKYSKIVSTYTNGLLPYVNEKGLIHTIYNQTLTLTGRLSSSEPNLQNISVRDEIGKEVRKAFIPKSEDNLFLSFDYSQVELRVLASIAKDQNMINAFKQGIDIHTNTAANVFGLAPEQVSNEQRRSAKAINFGIVYGISDWGLSEQIGISPKDAKNFIDRYFLSFPSIKQYMEDIVEKAKNEGYVTTLLNRKRYIDELKSPTYMIREFGKRVAMNTPIQGTAADIIKIAMINVYKMLKEKNLKTTMIMQVHDELIFEVPKEELDIVIPLISYEMENALKLEVELKVEYGYGSNWFNTK